MHLPSSTVLPQSFSRPEKITWTLPPKFICSNWSEQIPSNSLRKQAIHLEEILAKEQISFSLIPLTSMLYATWLEFYTARMCELGHDVFAKSTWYDQHSNMEKELWLLRFEKVGEYVGGAILSSSPAGIWTQHFKASQRLHVANGKNYSLGSLMELVFIDQAVKNNASTISSGTSRNAFGYYNTLGYLIFKLRSGYLPSPALKFGCDYNFQARDSATPTAWFVVNEETRPVLLMYPNPSYFSDELILYVEKAELKMLSYQ